MKNSRDNPKTLTQPPNQTYSYPSKPLNLSLRLQDGVSIDEEFVVKEYIEREVESEIKKFLLDPEILVLRGPRQAGKTTLLKRVGQKLAAKYGENQVLLFNFEDDLVKKQFVDNPKAFIEYYLPKKQGGGPQKRLNSPQNHLNSPQKPNANSQKLHNSPQKKDNSQLTKQPLVFFLLDEVQYIKHAGKLLKLLYDVYPQVKLVATGSSSLDLNQLGRYLVGRAIYFEIYPFSFAEFLQVKDQKLKREYRKHQLNLKQPQEQSTDFIQDLNSALKEYLTYGGYPRIVLEQDPEKKRVLLRNIYNTYVEKDVAALFGSKYKHKLLDIVSYLAAAAGQMVQYQKICNTVGVSSNQLKQTLDILEQTYLVKQIKPYYKNQVTELKKNPKFYFIDPGMRNALLDRFEFNQVEYGQLLENLVLLRLLNLKYQPKYWRTTAKAEIDFVLPKTKMPIEVKKKAKITRALHSFIKTYQPKTAIVTDLEKTGVEVISNTKVYTVPIGLI